MKRQVTLDEVAGAAHALAASLEPLAKERQLYGHIKLHGVPRGGIPAALAVAAACPSWWDVKLVNDPFDADFIIDDIYDTGNTFKRHEAVAASFHVLFDKRTPEWAGAWLVMPWETGSEDTSDHDIVVRLLQRIGEDPNRPGLVETPARVAKAWQEWFGGYDRKPEDILKVFEDGAEGVNELVLVDNIPVYSHCEHHLAPFFGVAHIGYIPNGRIVGLSKMSRLVDVFSRRLQVQERLTKQIADALDENLKPVGVGVIVECRHMCMESRGVERVGSSTTTSALRGVLMDNGSARAEFMALINAKRGCNGKR